MERRKVLAVAVSGKALALPPDSRLTWLPLTDSNGVALVGVSGRQEDDVEYALSLASTALGDGRKLAIKEIPIQVDKKKVQLESPKEFELELARLEPGEAWVSPEIAKVYGRQFLFEEISDPKGDWFLLRGKRGRPSRVRGLRPTHAPLVGRSHELSELCEFVDQIREDEGQIVAIVGDAGIGKTRLLEAFKEKVQPKTQVFEGAFKVGTQRPYEAFRSIVTALVGGVSATLSRWEMTEAETDFLRLFLEPDQKIERLTDLTEEQIRQGLFFSVRKLLHSAAKNPIVCVLEDVHWADRSSLDLLEYLVEGIEKTRLLMLFLHRPEVSGPWQKRLNYTEIKMTPFVSDEVEKFVKELLTVTQVDQRLTRELSRISLGNPLFVEEILRSLLDRSILETETIDRGGKTAVLAGDFPQDVPTTLRTLLVSRLDRLSEEAKDSLRWASLLGSSFETLELGELLKREGFSNSEQILKDLEAQSFIKQKSEFPKQVHQFVHDLLFEVVQESVGDRAKRQTEIARFLGETLPKESLDSVTRVAEHALRGDDDDLAVMSGLEAGKMLTDHNRFPQAAAIYKDSAKRWEDRKLSKPAPEEVYGPLVQALLSVGELENSKGALERWKTWSGRLTARGEASLAHLEVRYHSALGDEKAVIEASERALKLMAAFPEFGDEKYDVIHDRVDAMLGQGQAAKAFHESLVALKELERNPNPIARMRIWARSAYCATLAGSPNIALEFVNRARAIAPNDLSPNLRMELARRIGNTYDALDQYEDAIRVYTDAIEQAKELGLRGWLAELTMHRGVEAAMDGDYKLGLADAKRALEIATEIRNATIVSRSLFNVLDALVELGALEESRAWYAKWSNVIAESTEGRQSARIAMMQAELAVLEGNFEKGSQFNREAARMLYAINDITYAGGTLFRALVFEVLGKCKSSHDLEREYNRLCDEGRNIRGAYWEGWQPVAAFFLAANGCRDLTLGPCEDLDPGTSKASHLRQLLYVAKIAWLKSIGKRDAADQLRGLYREERKRIARRVPQEYLEVFEKHPLFQIPE